MRVKLTVDLTKYDPRCTIGTEGNTVPPTLRGSDAIVGVSFDSGACLDVFWSGLQIIDTEYLRQCAEEEAEEARTAKNVVMYVGPRGGFHHLSYVCPQQSAHPLLGELTVSDGSKQSAHRKLELFAKHRVPVRVEVIQSAKRDSRQRP